MQRPSGQGKAVEAARASPGWYLGFAPQVGVKFEPALLEKVAVDLMSLPIGCFRSWFGSAEVLEAEHWALEAEH